MNATFAPRMLGNTQIPVGPLGLGSSFGLPARDVERAFERGVNFFLWGSLRRRDFGKGLRNLAQRDRAKMAIAIQSYTRIGWMMEWSVNSALRFLKTDYVDVLTLSWWNAPPPERILDAAMRLRDKGKVRHLMISCHHRPTFPTIAKDPRFGALMIRYNAAHPGAEQEVFPYLDEARPGTVAFTATRWGTLLDPRLTPAGEATPRASDCYRFGMTQPKIDVCLAGPKDAAQLDEALVALDRGPLDDDEMAWIRRVGSAVRAATANRAGLVTRLDRLTTVPLCKPRQLPG